MMNEGPTFDEVLMKRVASGHHSSLNALVRRFAPQLMTAIKRTMVDHHHCEDIFQDVVLAVWKNRARYEYPRPVKPWLFKIAINRCWEELRKQRVRGKNDPRDVSEIQCHDPPDALVVTNESRKAINHAIEKLPDQQRAVVVMRIWNAMTYREIAIVIGVGESTVRSYMHHALASLRKSLNPIRP